MPVACSAKCNVSPRLEPPPCLGGMGIGISELDGQIEACDGSPDTTRRLLADHNPAKADG